AEVDKMNTSCLALDPCPTVVVRGRQRLEDNLDKKRLLSSGDKEEAVADALIRQRVEDYANAISTKDIDGVMSFFAPNLVSFDIATKTLRYLGAENKRRAWQNVFPTYRSIASHIHHLHLTPPAD